MNARAPCSRGFTLIEAMIVVTVLAIVAAIAFPSYSNYVIRANRAAAKAAVMRIAGQQESFYTDRKVYAASMAELSLPIYLRRDSNLQPANDAAAIYKLTITPTAAGYSIDAEPVNSQVRDTDCGTLSFDSTGLKTASTGRADCWTR